MLYLSRIGRMWVWFRAWSRGLNQTIAWNNHDKKSYISSRGTFDNRFKCFVTDRSDGPGLHKWSHYLEYYGEFLSIGEEPVTVLEIGVQSGGSLDMWDKVLPRGSVIVGLDVNGECKRYENGRVSVEIGSQCDISFINDIGTKYGPFDIIVDDGSHIPTHQEISLVELIKYVKPGGTYIIEDIHGRDNSFTAFVFGLVSQLNEMKPDSDFFDCQTNGIQKSVTSVSFGPFFCTLQVGRSVLHKLTDFKSGNNWIPY